MQNNDDLLYDLLRVIGQECLRQADARNGVGCRDFEIESVRRLPDDPHWAFEATTWTEQSTDPEKVHRLDYIQLVEMITRAVSHSVLHLAAEEIRKRAPEEVAGLSPDKPASPIDRQTLETVHKEIFDSLDIKVTKTGSSSQFELVDRKNKGIPSVVVERISDTTRWKCYIPNTNGGTMLGEREYRTKRECVAMAKYHLARHLAKLRIEKQD